jgi:hypothetical protein
LNSLSNLARQYKSRTCILLGSSELELVTVGDHVSLEVLTFS